MRIVDHAYFGWESEVGSPISRDPFAAAQIRPRVPLDACLLWGQKKLWWRVDVFLVNSDQSSLKRGKTKDNGSLGPLHRNEFRKSYLVGQ